MSTEKEFLKVRAIKNGTVIDHIPASAVFNVIKLLELDKVENEIIFGTNLGSKLMDKKALIKIVDKYFGEDELSYLALVAPMASVSTIKDFEVVEKHKIQPPKEVNGYVCCANPMCITNKEDICTHFTVTLKESGELALKCRYCEKETRINSLKLIK